jgi:hypothetical protein
MQAVQLPVGLGQAIMLGVDPNDESRWHRTTVVRVDDHGVWVDARSEESESGLVVPAGSDITCQTWRAMDALYTLRARVLRLDWVRRPTPSADDRAEEQTDARPLLGLDVYECTRVQQRTFVRVQVSMNAPARIKPKEGEPRRFMLKVRDVSAGGLRAGANELLSVGDELDLALRLPRDSESPTVDTPRGQELDLLVLRARVARVVEMPYAALRYDVGLAFLDVPADVSERIIRFVLNTQRELRRVGMR